MTVADIEPLVEWQDNGIGRLSLFVPLFGCELPFALFRDFDAEPIVTEKLVAGIADVTALGPDRLPVIKDMLWDEANFAFEISDYGVEAAEGETSREAHLREYGVAGPEDAWRLATVREIHVFDEHGPRYAVIQIDTVADNLIGIVVKDGRIIDWDDDGTHLPGFDTDERAASGKRATLLGG